MENKKKGIVSKIVDDLVESTKTQHEISKVQHELNKKSPSEAKEEFLARHAEAKKPPIQKQKEQLAQLQEQLNHKRG